MGQVRYRKKNKKHTAVESWQVCHQLDRQRISTDTRRHIFYDDDDNYNDDTVL